MTADTEFRSVDEMIATAKWIDSLTADQCRDLLFFLCGYRPGLMANLKAEREDVDA